MAVKEKSEPLTGLAGKTYSLFGSGPSPREYYRTISLLADHVLEQERDIAVVMAILERVSRRRRFLKKQLQATRSGDPLVSLVLAEARKVLAPHTTLVKAHLRELSLFKRWDATLFTSEGPMPGLAGPPPPPPQPAPAG